MSVVQSLTTCDIILIVASAARGVPARILTMDLARNEIDNDGVTVLVRAIESGVLQDLIELDLSSNPASNKSDAFEALKAHAPLNEETKEVFRYFVEAGHEFRIVREDMESAMRMRAAVDDDDF